MSATNSADAQGSDEEAYPETKDVLSFPKSTALALGRQPVAKNTCALHLWTSIQYPVVLCIVLLLRDILLSARSLRGTPWMPEDLRVGLLLDMRGAVSRSGISFQELGKESRFYLMPQSTEELRNKFPGGLEEALQVLAENFVDQRGLIVSKRSGYCPTERENEAIDYLFTEWDFAYDPSVV